MEDPGQEDAVRWRGDIPVLPSEGFLPVNTSLKPPWLIGCV